MTRQGAEGLHEFSGFLEARLRPGREWNQVKSILPNLAPEKSRSTRCRKSWVCVSLYISPGAFSEVVSSKFEDIFLVFLRDLLQSFCE